MQIYLLRKIIAMSKFFFFMAWLQCLFMTTAFANNGYAQLLENASISNDWRKVKLEAAFADIQQQTNFFFTYDSKQIEKVTITSSNEELPLLEVLKFIASQTGLKFSIADDLILVDYDKDESNSAKLTRKEILLPPLQQLEQLTFDVVYQVKLQNVAADQIIKGKVIDVNGQPLVGATVQAKDMQTGTVSDVDGSFSLAVPDNAKNVVLVVSYVGYLTKEVIWDGNEVAVVLMEDVERLDEVLVIGYGTGTKEKFNGASSKVDNERINNYSAASLDQAIAGTIAGVQISGNNKNPGENSVIQIRGINTLTAGTNPLIVVDGNPLTEGSSLSSINTQDIESISVLKDAASAAIYGSRASNGVILITTKKGQEGKLQVTYDGYIGVQQRIDKFELTDAYETAQFDFDARNFGYISGGKSRSITDDNATRDANKGGKRSRIQPFLQDYLDGKPGLTNTDWADAVFRDAPQQNHYLNFSGGNNSTDYAISFGYFDADNIVIDSDYERYTNNFKLNTQINDRIKFGIASNITISNAQPIGYSAWSDFSISNAPDPAQAIFLMFPYYSVYNEDGSLAVATQLEDNNANWDGPISGNAVATMELTDYTERFFRVFGSTFLEIELLEDLTFKTSLGGDFNSGVEEFFSPTTLGNYRTPVANSTAIGYKEDNKRENFINENLLTYDKSFGKHSLNVLGGYSYQQEQRNNVRLQSTDFVDDNLRNISGATNPTATNSSSKWVLTSLFGRVQYDFSSKYSLSASLRRDGSSRFGENTKFGDFASLSAGWVISNESFFPQNSLISFAKARVSWGQTGNNQIGDFAAIALIGEDNYVIDGTLEAGSYTQTSPNADLSWETNTSFNIGADLGLMNNKLFLSAEYYVSNTTDLLLSVPVPQQSGFSSSLQNIGELENRGFELELRGTGYKVGQINLGFNANWATTENEVIALGNDQNQIIQNNGIDFITAIGQPMAQMYVYDILDVYRTQEQIDGDPIKPLAGTEVGDYVVRDANGDGKITSDDRTPSGDFNPDFTYGFGINADYKGFDLSLQFNGIEGRKAVDRMVWYAESGEGFFVPSQYYYDNYFSDRNPDGFLRRPDFASFSSAGRLTRNSTLNILDADYFRLRSLQFGYTLPTVMTQRFGVQSLRLYITGNNIFNLSDYRGYNPDGIDNSSNTRQTLTRGYITTTNPLTRFVAFGVNVKF